MAADLIPCPLTLFVIAFAMARGVPEAGLAFATTMLMGVTLTLGAVAALAVAGRQVVLAKANFVTAQRTLTRLVGAFLIMVAIVELFG